MKEGEEKENGEEAKHSTNPDAVKSKSLNKKKLLIHDQISILSWV